MNTTLVINPKGGSGKTTIAVNLASCLAAHNIPTTLMDYDPQGSSLHWLRSRDAAAPRIHGASGAPEKYGRLRSLEMYVPPQTQQLVIDAPAGASGLLLHEMLDRAHCILVPIIASPIDIHATGNFIKELLVNNRLRTRNVRVAAVANKVRVSMPAYQPLLHFLESLALRPLARLLDSDAYLRAAESGIGIFEMEPRETAAERSQFRPIVDWVIGTQSPGEESRAEVTQIRRVAY